MSYIKAVIGGKAKGLADQVTIDPALGCKNACIGCYAKKTSQRGSSYDNVMRKELDKEVLKKSIRHTIKKGFLLGRVGKHCDPGDHIDNLNGVLDCCSDEGFKCVVVSKSLPYIQDTADKFIKGNHILHMSLGPYSIMAPSEGNRIDVAINYKRQRVNTFIRLTRDITQEITTKDKELFESFICIVTPLRFITMTQLRFYGAETVSFEYISGYYKPKVVHATWEPYMINVCGEINEVDRCCNCMAEG